MITYRLQQIPRLPLDGSIDLTYRCNNKCRHCWLWLIPHVSIIDEELSFEEIRSLVDEARQMGCQAWMISGGEPMVRQDFSDLFDYITRKSITYTLNTNGTLITPKIAQLMKRKGRKMVALYGATAEVHDHITRNPGSFNATMQGFAYLKEAKANFEVQIIPMRDNYHQLAAMEEIAQTLSPTYRIGAAWLWLSACRSEACNQEITAQRLEPAEVLMLDEPNPLSERAQPSPIKNMPVGDHNSNNLVEDDRLYAKCIASRHHFHIDAFGKMSFCSFIKDPTLRYDLRHGSFREAWEEFIPSLADKVHGGQEYFENCGTCDLRKDCQWCAAYAYLEHGHHSAKINYLCNIAKEKHRFKEDWKMKHLRYYEIAGITIQLRANFPFEENTFLSKFNGFRVNEPGPDLIDIQLISSTPKLSELNLTQEIYDQPPWQIFKQQNSLVYVMRSQDEKTDYPNAIALADKDYSNIKIYRSNKNFEWQNLSSLTTFPSDQILLAELLANRRACFVHASGIKISGQGLLFIGHSGVGKSTTMKFLREQGEILCDDRVIIRRWPEGFRIHGTWSHGELPDISPTSAPLKAIMYLEQADTNELIPISNMQTRITKFLVHVVRPLAIADWWHKTFDLAEIVCKEVPTYSLKFDKSGKINDVLSSLYT